MIRALMAVAAPIAVAALAAVPLLGAGVLSGPTGEPLLVSAGPASLHKASFEGCAAGAEAAAVSQIRVVALTLSEDESSFSISFREVPAGASLAGATLVVLFDASGEVLFAGDAAALAAGGAADAFVLDCGNTPTPRAAGSI